MTIIVDAGRWQLNNSLVRTGDAARFLSMAKERGTGDLSGDPPSAASARSRYAERQDRSIRLMVK
ncbi:MAG: hypothetical protein KAS38_00010 [Anaerolineales bacterium]|nr:hypothetical protein [Anaerolineales bacterium]